MEQRQAGIPVFVLSDFHFDTADKARLAAAIGPEALLLVHDQDALVEALRAHPETDVLLSLHAPANVFDLAPRLCWLALPSAGADSALRKGLVRPGGPTVTTASGIHAIQIGEFVFAMLLMWVRQWPAIFEQRRRRQWPDTAHWVELGGRELYGSTLLIVGLGAIGRRIAYLGRAFGMRILATRRSATPGAIDPDVDELAPQSDLHRLLSGADYVVIAVPSTPETHHLIGEAELAAMTPRAFLVNIARGDVIDETALIAALQCGAIGGAGLDVFEREPLPSESPLWTLPNVILSPHLAGSSDHYSQRLTDLFLDNLARYRAGQPLRNTVDPQRGY
jgi:phosphoglycerate dehydrogenase-like enzyme